MKRNVLTQLPAHQSNKVVRSPSCVALYAFLLLTFTLFEVQNAFAGSQYFEAPNTTTPDCNAAVTLQLGGLVNNNMTAVGCGARAAGPNSSAFGQGSTAWGIGTTAVGENASAYSAGLNRADYATAIGYNTQALQSQATAVGASAIANWYSATALGYNSFSGELSVASGANSQASALSTVAYGANSQATQTSSSALGYGARASSYAATAVGSFATATGDSSTALGNQSSTAGYANSTAIGAGATNTQTNQMMFGTSATTYTAPGITSSASRAAQSGSTQFVSTDANGNLASSGFGPQDIANLQNGQAILGQTVYSQGQRINSNQNEARQGIAMAAAMSQAPMPSAPGKTSWKLNNAIYKNAAATSLSIAHRLPTKVPVAITAGVAVGLKNSAIVTGGLQGEF